MQYSMFGKTGLKVSRLGFGAMRLPMIGDDVDYDEATELMRKAFELGVNYVDSANGYCKEKSQIAVGRAIKGWRDKVIVSTKNPYMGSSGDEWRKYLDNSLKRLDVDRIDFYHFHGIGLKNFEGDLSAKDGPIDRAKKALDEGVIRFLSFSFHDDPENMVKIAKSGLFSSVLCQYNLLDSKNEESMQAVHEMGLGVAVMGPVGGGRLVGFSDQVRKLLKDGSSSTPEMALRFVLSNPDVDIALSGMSTIEMVRENVRTASLETTLTEKERLHFIEMVEELQDLSDLPCTDCGYCIPCPSEVFIPRNFMLYNLHKVFGLTDAARNWYQMMGGELLLGKRASFCTECGECIEKCPQKINIPERLKDCVKVFGEQT